MTSVISSAMAAASTASLFGDVFIIATYFIVKNVRDKMYMKIIFIIALYNFIYSLATVIGEQRVGTVGCYFQAMLSCACSLSGMFWTVLLTRLLQRIVMLNQRFPMDSILSFQGVIASGLPIMLTVLPLSGNSSFGPVSGADVGFCFLSQRTRFSPGTLIWLILSFYFWMWCSVLWIAYIFVDIIFHMNTMLTSERTRPLHSMIYRQFEKFFPYPLIVSLCWSLPTVADLSTATNHEERTFAFRLFSTLLPLSVGFLNACVFIRSNSEMLYSEWSHVIGYFRWCCCGRKVGVESNSKLTINLSLPSNWKTRERHDAQVEVTRLGGLRMSILDVNIGGMLKLKPPPAQSSSRVHHYAASLSTIGGGGGGTIAGGVGGGGGVGVGGGGGGPLTSVNLPALESQFQPICVDDKSMDEAGFAAFNRSSTIPTSVSGGCRTARDYVFLPRHSCGSLIEQPGEGNV